MNTIRHACQKLIVIYLIIMYIYLKIYPTALPLYACSRTHFLPQVTQCEIVGKRK